MPSCTALSWRLRGGAVLVCAFLVMCGFGRPASAETIAEALADAYLINPVLNAERARLRAIDEEVALAKSGLRPFIFGTADTAFLNTNTTTDQREQHPSFRCRFVNRAYQPDIPDHYATRRHRSNSS